MDACVICGASQPRFALPLTKADNQWVVKPICGSCKQGLQAEAKAAGKFIAIYGLESSLKEAEARNANSLRFQPFLQAFARASQAKSDMKSENKPKLVKVPAKASA